MANNIIIHTIIKSAEKISIAKIKKKPFLFKNGF